MKDLTYSATINAPAQKVWEVLWGADTYNQWTKFFNPASRMESDWTVGGKTMFTDAEGNGMISTIKELAGPHQVVFEHLGMIENGVEDTTSDKVKSWAGAIEKYTLTENADQTTLDVLVQTDEGFEEMMNNGFTLGLQAVKELAES